MKNKILFIFLLLICIFLIPSFCSANFEFNFEGKNYNLPDFEQYENTFIFFNNANFDGFDIWSFSGSNTQMSFKKSTNDNYPEQIHFSFLSGSGGSYVYWYRYDIKNKSFTCFYDNQFYNENKGFSGGNITGVFVYSTFDIKSKEGEIFFEDSTKIKFNLHVDPVEQTTNVPVKIFTDWYSLDEFSDVLVKYSYDNEKWQDCGWGRYMNPSTGQEESLWRFELDVYSNDTYYFKFIDLRNNREEYTTVVIKNIVYTQDNPRKLY